MTPSPKPMPFPLMLASVEREQRLHCAHRPTCLATAAREGWPGLTCAHCSAYEPPDELDLRMELLALSAFAQWLESSDAVARPLALRDDPHNVVRRRSVARRRQSVVVEHVDEHEEGNES